MFIHCPHCQALVATDPATDAPPARCPRCAEALDTGAGTARRTAGAVDAARAPAARPDPAARPAKARKAAMAPRERSGATTEPALPDGADDNAGDDADAHARDGGGEAAADGTAMAPGAGADTGHVPGVATPPTSAQAGPVGDGGAADDPGRGQAGTPLDDAASEPRVAAPGDGIAVLTDSPDAGDAAGMAGPRSHAERSAGDAGPDVAGNEAGVGLGEHADPAHVHGADDGPIAGPADLADAAAPVPAPDPLPLAAGAAAPAFARRRGAPPRRGRAWPTGAAIGVLSLLLGVQWLLADRARLAADARWRPVVARTCAMFGCTLPPWHEPGALTLLARDVRAHPHRAGVLHASATFRNDARWPQAWPRLVLTLADVDGRTVGARVLAPGEYLGHEPTENGIASGQVATIAFDVLEPGLRVVSFSFEFL